MEDITLNVKCFNCGNIYNGNFCPNCGAPANPPRMQSQPNPYRNRPYMKPQRKSTPVVLVLLITFLSIGVFFTIVISIMTNFSNSISDNGTVNAVEEISDFRKVTGATLEKEILITDILADCGVDSIDSIEYDESLDDMNEDGETGYRISTGDVNNVILYLNPDMTVNIIRYADNNLYEDGEVLSSINDYIITWDEASDLQISCQNAIKAILKSPSTAKFPNITKWGFSKQDGKITVQGYVDSQNSFGAELRSEFQFILSADDKTVKSLIFDGEEMISK